jgi:hypothetical protein
VKQTVCGHACIFIPILVFACMNTGKKDLFKICSLHVILSVNSIITRSAKSDNEDFLPCMFTPRVIFGKMHEKNYCKIDEGYLGVYTSKTHVNHI